MVTRKEIPDSGNFFEGMDWWRALGDLLESGGLRKATQRGGI